MRRQLSVFVGLWLGLWACAQAVPVLNQPLVVQDGRSSHVSGGGSVGFILYDRIELAQSAQVDSLSWVGAFIDTAITGNNPVSLPSNFTWRMQVLADAAGTPGTVTDSAAVAFNAVTATLLGQVSLAGSTVNVYRFAASLVDPLLIAGGVDQWFTVFADSSVADPRFAWFSGSGGDGVSLQRSLANQTFTSFGDRALTLDGTLVVPEPALLPPLALVLLALARRARQPALERCGA